MSNLTLVVLTVSVIAHKTTYHEFFCEIISIELVIIVQIY